MARFHFSVCVDAHFALLWLINQTRTSQTITSIEYLLRDRMTSISRSSATINNVAHSMFLVDFVQWCFFLMRGKKKNSQREERAHSETESCASSLQRRLRWWDTICCSRAAGSSSAKLGLWKLRSGPDKKTFWWSHWWPSSLRESSGFGGRRESESAWRDGCSWWWGLSLWV